MKMLNECNNHFKENYGYNYMCPICKAIFVFDSINRFKKVCNEPLMLIIKCPNCGEEHIGVEGGNLNIFKSLKRRKMFISLYSKLYSNFYCLDDCERSMRNVNDRT